MTKLYTLSEQFRELQGLVDNADEDMAVAVRDTMQMIEGEFQAKAQAITSLALNLDSDVEAIDGEIKRLQERKRLITNRQGQLKEYLRENMEATGITKISCPLFTITLAKGKQVAVVDKKDSIPDDFMRVTTSIEPDKLAIVAALKAGQEVPGTHLETGKSSIRIK